MQLWLRTSVFWALIQTMRTERGGTWQGMLDRTPSQPCSKTAEQTSLCDILPIVCPLCVWKVCCHFKHRYLQDFVGDHGCLFLVLHSIRKDPELPGSMKPWKIMKVTAVITSDSPQVTAKSKVQQLLSRTCCSTCWTLMSRTQSACRPATGCISAYFSYLYDVLWLWLRNFNHGK